MSYPTLLLHVAIQKDNAARLAVARDLAERFDAAVIGTAACEPQPQAYIDGIYPVEVIEADKTFADEQLAAAEAEFRQAMQGREGRIEWRSALAQPGRHVARLARAADLVITGAVPPDLLADPNWRLDPGDLAMQAGRPLLVVPEGCRRLEARTIVIGWKDTRESRRAVLDALPLARRAERVLVASVAEDPDAPAGVADVIAWFRSHGVVAENRSQPLFSDPASQIRTLAWDKQADLIVAGAYGHTRMREWVLGGVTHELLNGRTSQCLLLSH
jgi:nucleotide-binding universal stress UspA family protein